MRHFQGCFRTNGHAGGQPLQNGPFGCPDQRGGTGVKSYCSKSSDRTSPRRMPVVVVRCKNIIPSPISLKRSIRQILLHSPRHCLGMGLIFSQPRLRHHELQSGWRRPHEILHCIPIFLLRAVLIAGDYREFLQIDLLLRKPQPRYRRTNAGQFFPCCSHCPSPIRRTLTTPSISASASKHSWDGCSNKSISV